MQGKIIIKFKNNNRYTKQVSRVVRWLDLLCNFDGQFTSASGKYRGYKTSNPQNDLIFCFYDKKAVK